MEQALCCSTRRLQFSHQADGDRGHRRWPGFGTQSIVAKTLVHKFFKFISQQCGTVLMFRLRAADCVGHLRPARAWVKTLKTEPCISRWQLATSSRRCCCTGDRQFIQQPVFLPTASGEIRCRLHRRDLSSVFMAFGVPDTPWHPQLFCAVSFEPQRLSEAVY